MFYSQYLLAAKGPLSKVWLAAHWDSKLKKAQVTSTDIIKAADDIVNPKYPLALRMSGHLLLGLARIYRRKVIYLMDDCSEAMTKIGLTLQPQNVDLPAGAGGGGAAINLGASGVHGGGLQDDGSSVDAPSFDPEFDAGLNAQLGMVAGDTWGLLEDASGGDLLHLEEEGLGREEVAEEEFLPELGSAAGLGMLGASEDDFLSSTSGVGGKLGGVSASSRRSLTLEQARGHPESARGEQGQGATPTAARRVSGGSALLGREGQDDGEGLGLLRRSDAGLDLLNDGGFGEVDLGPVGAWDDAQAGGGGGGALLASSQLDLQVDKSGFSTSSKKRGVAALADSDDASSVASAARLGLATAADLAVAAAKTPRARADERDASDAGKAGAEAGGARRATKRAARPDEPEGDDGKEVVTMLSSDEIRAMLGDVSSTLLPPAAGARRIEALHVALGLAHAPIATPAAAEAALQRFSLLRGGDAAPEPLAPPSGLRRLSASVQAKCAELMAERAKRRRMERLQRPTAFDDQLDLPRAGTDDLERGHDDVLDAVEDDDDLLALAPAADARKPRRSRRDEDGQGDERDERDEAGAGFGARATDDFDGGFGEMEGALGTAAVPFQLDDEREDDRRSVAGSVTGPVAVAATGRPSRLEEQISEAAASAALVRRSRATGAGADDDEDEQEQEQEWTEIEKSTNLAKWDVRTQAIFKALARHIRGGGAQEDEGEGRAGREAEPAHFADFVRDSTRQTVALAFYNLLIFRSADVVDTAQEAPYAPIDVGRGPKFDDALRAVQS